MLCTNVMHLDLHSDSDREPVKGSQLQISCVFEAAGSGSRVKDNIRLEVGPPPPIRGAGREVVRDAEGVAGSPERRECMRMMEQESPRERVTDWMG